jgi:nicotinamide-nucleotide amidase
VAPLLADRYGGELLIERRWFRTTGIGESDLFDRIGGLEDLAPEVNLAYLPAPEGVALYVTGRGTDLEELRVKMDQAEARVREAAGSCLFAGENVDIAGYVAGLLLERDQTVAVAESCTGGLIAHSLTDVPGASGWFLRGWVTYSNEAKEEELQVPKDLMVEHGAVSEQVAQAMAEGALKNAGSDWAVAVTGIAGPTGGTEEKPVGLTFVACAGGSETVVRRYLLGEGGRSRNKIRSTAVALDLLRRRLEDLDPYEGGWEVHR